MEDWETLCRYVNEETFEKMGWDVETFKSLYKEDAIEQLREYMYQYGITNRYSVCMFLATLGKECGDGKYLMEDRGEEGEGEEIKKRNEEEFRNLTYEYETRGAGLIQLTGVDQKEFLEFLKNKIETDPNMEKNKLEGINRMLDGYPDVFPIKIINGESETCCVNSENVTQFVATDYPIESAVWYWASYNKCIYYTDYDNGNSSTMPLNEYVQS